MNDQPVQLTRREILVKIYNEQLEHLVRNEVDVKLFTKRLVDINSGADQNIYTKEQIDGMETELKESERRVAIKTSLIAILAEKIELEAKERPA